MLHVLFVIWRFKSPKSFTGMGGAENQLLKLMNTLMDDCHHLTVITRKTGNDPSEEFLSDHIRILRLQTTSIPGISMLVFFFLLPLAVVRCHLSNRIDVMHLPLPDLFVVAVYFLKLVLKIPAIARVAADEYLVPRHSRGVGKFSKYIIRSVMVRMDAIQTLTPAAYKSASKLGLGTTYLIPNGVLLPQEHRDYRNLTNRITYIGAMRFFPHKQRIEQKNLVFLIESFAALLESMPDVELVLVGDGNYRRRLEELVKRKGLSQSISFVGYQSGINKYLLETDIFVNPSLHEGLPNTVIEAMASGVYALCSNIHAHRYLIGDGVYGDVFNHHSTEDFVRMVLRFYANPAAFTKKARDARELVQREFSMTNNVRRITSMYRDVIAAFA